MPLDIFFLIVAVVTPLITARLECLLRLVPEGVDANSFAERILGFEDFAA